jgi:hypothetical protein
MRWCRVFVLLLTIAAPVLARAQEGMMRAATTASVLNCFVKVDALDFEAIVPPPPCLPRFGRNSHRHQ